MEDVFGFSKKSLNLCFFVCDFWNLVKTYDLSMKNRVDVFPLNFIDDNRCSSFLTCFNLI